MRTNWRWAEKKDQVGPILDEKSPIAPPARDRLQRGIQLVLPVQTRPAFNQIGVQGTPCFPPWQDVNHVLRTPPLWKQPGHRQLQCPCLFAAVTVKTSMASRHQDQRLLDLKYNLMWEPYQQIQDSGVLVGRAVSGWTWLQSLALSLTSCMDLVKPLHFSGVCFPCLKGF